MANEETATVRDGLFGTLDAVLRGGWADESGLAPAGVRQRCRRLLVLGLLLGATYGASLGAYGLCHRGDQPALQLLSAALKLPLMFGLTLVVTFPSLYVFAALMRSPLGGLATARQLLVAIVVHLAVLASLGPVFAFFAASTESYPFLLLLHVLFCAIGGFISLVVLRRGTAVMFPPAPFAAQSPPQPQPPRPQPVPEAPEPPPEPPHEPPPKRARAQPQSQRLLTAWCLLYGTVGAQMGWLLRPFLIEPGHAFSWLCPRESNVFAALIKTWIDLLSGR